MSTPQPPYEPTPQPAPQPVAAQPGKGLSIAAIIFAFVMPVVGLILGIVAMVQSKKAGQKNGLALASVIIAAVLIVLGIIIWIVAIASLATVGGGVMDAAQACADGATSVEVAGQTVMCSDVM